MFPSFSRVLYCLALFLSLVFSAQAADNDHNNESLNNTDGDQLHYIYVTEADYTVSIADASANAQEGAPRIAAGPSYWDGISLSTSLAALQTSLNQTPIFDQSSTSIVNDTAYFSWKGATGIHEWVVLASNDTLPLSITAHFWQEILSIDFETSIRVDHTARYVRALAVSAGGEVLGATPVLDMITEDTIDESFNSTLFTSQWERMRAEKTKCFFARGCFTGLKQMLRNVASGKGTVKLLCLIVGVVIGVCGLAMMAAGICNLLRSRLRRSRMRKRRSNSSSNETRGMYRVVETCDDERQEIILQLKKFRFEVSVDEVEEDEGDELV